MSTTLNRRELIALAAAAAGAVAMSLPAMADTAPAGGSSAAIPTPAKAPDTTLEGVALVSAAYAAAGYTIPDDQVAEVRKQLDGYPGDFAKARRLSLDNGIAPNMDVTAPLASPKK
jgi:hypothetical protein